MKITLASSSSYRQQLLKKLHIPFNAISPDIDETVLAGESVFDQVSRLAIVKAQAISDLYPEHYIIGSDQLACFDGKALGKPGNFIKAKEQLTMLSGKSVTFYTGLCLICKNTNQTAHTVEEYTVKFRTLTNKQIDTYLKIEQPYDCAGSFKSEGLGIILFESLSGRDPNSLIGLPLIALIELFKEVNVDLYNVITQTPITPE